jgi:hypothetical protein
MKNLYIFSVIVLLMASVIPAQAMEKDFVVHVLPAAILIDMEADSFEADSVSMDTTYLMPNMSMGVGLEFERVYLDITGGAGTILTSTFRSFLLQANIAAYWQPARSFNVGPHLGIIYFPNPSWLEDDDVDFDSTMGWMAGLQMAMGDKITYLVSVDLLSASFDATAGGTSKIDSDNLDIMGFGIQFGVRGIF